MNEPDFPGNPPNMGSMHEEANYHLRLDAQREAVFKNLPVDKSVGKEVANPEHVQAITRWLRLERGWGSREPIESYAEYAPDGMSKADLRAAFLSLKPHESWEQGSDVSRGALLTALADKILREEFDKRFPDGATLEEEHKFWDEEAIIELQRPQRTDKHAYFGHLGTYWTRGALVLKGDFGGDPDIGWGMKGGRIVVLGNAGRNAGIFMNGGILEVVGNAPRHPGKGDKGGEVIIHNQHINYEPVNTEPTPTEIETATRNEYGEMSPKDLARGWVEYNSAKLLKTLDDAEKSLDYEKRLKQPKPPGPRPAGLEPGGLDASDWNNAQLEYNQWDDDHQGSIDYWENRVQELYDEQEGLRSDLELVNQGNTSLIRRYSSLEIDRRVKAEKDRVNRETSDAEWQRQAEDAKSEKEMDGAADVENDMKQIRNLLKEGVIPRSEKGPKGWMVSSDGLIFGFYNGSELSERTPSVRIDAGISSDNIVSIVVRDWRDAQPVEKHPFNRYGEARKGKFYSVRIKDGKASYYRAGEVIDSSHEFPSEEILATRDGFGQAQMYALRDIIEEAAEDLKDLGSQS